MNAHLCSTNDDWTPHLCQDLIAVVVIGRHYWLLANDKVSDRHVDATCDGARWYVDQTVSCDGVREDGTLVKNARKRISVGQTYFHRSKE